MDNIRQTKVLEKYLKTYIKKFEYERLYQISKILEGRTMTKLRLMIKYMARKWKTKKHQTILKYSRTIIGNKLHFVELIEYKVD